MWKIFGNVKKHNAQFWETIWKNDCTCGEKTFGQLFDNL